MTTFDANGYAEPGPVYFQLKASESVRPTEKWVTFDADIRDYNLWIHEEMPVILVLYDAARRKAYWIAIQAYFDEDEKRCPRRGAKTVRVRFSKRQTVSPAGIQKMREMKASIRRPRLGARP